MKKINIFVEMIAFLLLSAINLSAQTDSIFHSFENTHNRTKLKIVLFNEILNDSVYSHADILPEFSGGKMKLYEFITENLHYPTEALKSNIQGTVIVRFIVTKDGKIFMPTIIRGVAPLLDAEALHVVNKLPDFIKPGYKDGEPINVFYTIPVRFKIHGSYEVY
ncbi:MAG: energy transducer TonB [Paludibacter sp.]|nr:energy transducer TonB [Paludibacter sp.]